jgi:hypothetical protein
MTPHSVRKQLIFNVEIDLEVLKHHFAFFSYF